MESKLVGPVMFWSGLITLALIDWRIALCVFGMMWGNTDYKANQ